MGLFLCDLCNEHLSLKPHTCDHENIRKHFQQLEQNARTAERRLDEIKNCVFRVVEELPSLEGEEIVVKTEWLKRLWGNANCQWYEANTPEMFLVRWIALHGILCEAFDIFRSQKKENLLVKLQNLHKAVKHAQGVMGYKDSKLNMSPEDVLLWWRSSTSSSLPDTSWE